MTSQLAIYARVSSRKQEKDKTIDSQLSALRDFVLKNGLDLIEENIFTDNGVSGSSLERPALDRLRDKAFTGEIEQIIVHSPDRLARKYSHQIILTEEFKNMGVTVEFLNRKISQSPEDHLLFQVQGIISEYEREKIIERSRRGKLFKAKNGDLSVLSAAPYGYIYLPKNGQERASYQIHSEQAEVIKQVYHLLIEEQKTLGEITNLLNERHILTRTGLTRWRRSAVHGIVTNPAYKGLAAYNKTQVRDAKRPNRKTFLKGGYTTKALTGIRVRDKSDWIHIPVPAIVTESVYEQAQHQLAKNKRFSKRNQRRHYLLTGFLRCQECGYAITGYSSSKLSNGSRRLTYKCNGAVNANFPDGKPCTSHPVAAPILEDTIWDHIVKLLDQPELVHSEYQERLQQKINSGDLLEKLILKKSRDEKQIRNEHERMLDIYQTGGISKQDIVKRLEKINARLSKVQSELQHLEKEVGSREHQLTLIQKFGEFRQSIAKKLDTLSFEEKRKILELLVEDIIIDINKAEITIKHILAPSNNVDLCPRSVCSQ